MSDDIDVALERRMEITQLRTGDVLTEDNATEIRALFDELSSAEEENATVYDRGIQHGRDEAAGKEVGNLLRQIDKLRGELSVQKALTKFYLALSRPTSKESEP